MTGKCTGGVDLLDISGQPEGKQEQLGPLPLVPDLARSGPERQFRDRLGLRRRYMYAALKSGRFGRRAQRLWPRLSKSACCPLITQSLCQLIRGKGRQPACSAGKGEVDGRHAFVDVSWALLLPFLGGLAGAPALPRC